MVNQSPPLAEADRIELTRLEEGMWNDLRFDRSFIEQRFAPDFFEFGRSGRTYTREQSLAVPAEPIRAVIPLPNLRIRLLDGTTAQVTYDSAVTYGGVVEYAHRSSIWTRASSGWIMRFHQGTPYYPEPERAA